MLAYIYITNEQKAKFCFLARGGRILENTDKLDVATRTKLGETQVKTSVSVTFVGDAKITKVLTASVRPVVSNVVSTSGLIRFDGEMWYDFIVVLENGEVVPFSESVKFEDGLEDNIVKEGMPVCLDFNVVDISSSNGEYSSNVEFTAYVVETNNELSCAIPPEGVMTRDEDICFDSLVADGTYESKIDIELPKDSKTNKILFARSFASIKSIVPSTDYFAISGEVFSTIVTESSEGQIRTLTKETTFNEEIEAKNVNKDSNIQAVINMGETTINEETTENKFVLNFPFSINFTAYNQNQTKCVEDAYSLTNEVNLTTSSLVRDEFATTKLAEENLLTNFTLSDDILSIDKILAVIPLNVQVVNYEAKDNEIMVEGIASVNLVYNHEDEDGNNILSSVDIEVPYSLGFATPDVKSSDNVRLVSSFGDINVKARHGRELEILCELKLNYSIASQSISSITTEITLGEEKTPKDCALEIYVAKEDESLWDIAKKLNITVADLLSQNGELSLPIKEGQKIIAYNRLYQN